MAEMDGIKSSPEQGDFSRRGHDWRTLGGIAARFKRRRALPLVGNVGSFPPMTDAFEILGMEPKLVLSDDALREAFRDAGKRAHPDAGGGDGEFAALREAFAVVSSPSRRLRHWLDLRGTPGEVRGSIDNSLMDLFAEVGTVTQLAESVIRKRDEAKSALVRAMLEGETQVCREAVERVICQVETTINRECAVFPELEKSADPDIEAAARIARNLAFLEKWRAGLRACFGRLL
jgi:curved DNA-binding protein CbpA